MERAFIIKDVRAENKVIKAVIHLKKEHPIFKGHFPDKPILPGVVEIEIVRNVLDIYYNKTLHVKYVKYSKHINMILLDSIQNFTVEISSLVIDNEIEAKVIIKNEMLIFLKMKCIFTVQ